MSKDLGADSTRREEGSQEVAGRAHGTNDIKSVSKGQWWANPTIMVPAVLALIGLAISTFFALYPRSPQAINSLADCQQAHPHATGSAIAASSKALVGRVTNIKVEGCLWPPITGTDSGGLWTAEVTEYWIPGTYAAEKYDVVDVFTTSCQALKLDYQFNDQLTVAHTRLKVETNQTVSGYDGSPENLLAGGNVPGAVARALGTHLIVLFNGRYDLYSVECATVL